MSINELELISSPSIVLNTIARLEVYVLRFFTKRGMRVRIEYFLNIYRPYRGY